MAFCKSALAAEKSQHSSARQRHFPIRIEHSETATYKSQLLKEKLGVHTCLLPSSHA